MKKVITILTLLFSGITATAQTNLIYSGDSATMLIYRGGVGALGGFYMPVRDTSLTNGTITIQPSNGVVYVKENGYWRKAVDPTHIGSSKAGNIVTITSSTGTGTAFSVADNDSSATNELQTLAFDTTTRNLTIGSGNSVNIPLRIQAVSPLIPNNTGLIPSVSIPVANSSQNGYLHSTDWNLFYNKQAALVSSTTNTITSNEVRRAALTGDVTAPANSNTTTIANNAVNNAKLANGAVTDAKVTDVSWNKVINKPSLTENDTVNSGILNFKDANNTSLYAGFVAGNPGGGIVVGKGLRVANGIFGNNVFQAFKTADTTLISLTAGGGDAVPRTDSIPNGSYRIYQYPNASGTLALRSDLITIGTANGLSLAGSALSLAIATTSTPGAMSAADKTKLDGLQTASLGSGTANGYALATETLDFNNTYSNRSFAAWTTTATNGPGGFTYGGTLIRLFNPAGSGYNTELLISGAADDQVFVRRKTNGVQASWYQIASRTYVDAKLSTGSYTGSGNGSTTAFTISHSLGSTPADVNFCPTSAAAAGNYYVSAKTSTTFTITYLVAPASGTNNITGTFTVFK